MEIKAESIDAGHAAIINEILPLLGDVFLYERSVHEHDGDLFFIVRNGNEKKLVALSAENGSSTYDFEGDEIETGEYTVTISSLNYKHAEAIRRRFSFASPVLIGKKDSYGFGDRLGNAGPAHLRAVRDSEFKPILAQQSIRELERTKRTAQEVMDAATWAVFQEGYHDGFGADGDHLKNFDDVDVMVKAGYTMFTIDPGEYVKNDVKSMNTFRLEQAYQNLPWDEFKYQPAKLIRKFTAEKIELADGFILSPNENEVMQGMVKYGHVITHTAKMSDYILKTYPDHPSELELSVDETDETTTLFEHYLVASELNRLGVELVSLAPRFCGDFEKGIDFKGDLDQFRQEYIQHLAIAEKFGGYKLSIHSGSDKFSVYEVIGSLNSGAVHVKTAGTSYLEALRTMAEADPDFFRELLKFSLKRFETDKKTYHISAVPSRINDPDELNDNELLELLDNDDARQVLHVAYGSVLSGELPEAKNYKDRLMSLLETNEELHEKNLYNHFNKHLNPFQ